MTDEPATPKPEAPKGGGIVGALLGAVKLDWIRPLIFKVGGRKVAIGAFGIYSIGEIVKVPDYSDTLKIGASAAIAVIAGVVAFTIGHEDRGKPKE